MLQKNIKEIKDNVEHALANSPYQQIPQLIVVTKTQSVEDISELYHLGFRHFAENRVDALLKRQKEFPQKDIVWHLIGTLQTRKVKDIIEHIDYFHALDRLKLLDEIEKRAEKACSCFLQVNVFQEDSKHGFSMEEIDDVLLAIQNKHKVTIVGLMTMAPYNASEETIRRGFKMLKATQEKIQMKNIPNVPCQWTSMGMSQDYQLAIQEGATHIRIGSAFFKK